MGWSTSQLADLAGTTLRAIRHYHEVGLLAEPERRANGYKSYGVPHLVRVLRIKRLTGLGLSLAQIADLGDADEHPGEALRRLDAELAATIERLQRVRAELGVILSRETPTDLPPDLAQLVVEADMSPQDRAFTVVLAQLATPAALAAYADAVRRYSKDPVVVEFDTLPVDADEQTRQRLAERLGALPHVREMRAMFPDAAGMYAGAPRGEAFALQTIGKVVAELYNKAQIDVLIRMND
ncbi:MerR family transcriptional regulator [Actinosynnema sp. NPDC047251]|uniref:Transcriptional regulator, MerR family n=1 Tax=Saccharothrix espanaensis (strain ATCC 51144 / DSM 44229 / JCM 9112 / NBRC 15066 / NRRL 15764) TaxID=1179773 RepID=K0K2M8_SACES|nr:MerR family transcriptional regulator [Saccharothrix espanaensis]CCH31084.1 Transcriptional regulator, MerR family [Saccharothrix espanaensis DSM 44229]